VRDVKKQGRAFNRRQLRDLYRWLNHSSKTNPKDRIIARDVALIILAAETGLRANELVTLSAFGPEVQCCRNHFSGYNPPLSLAITR